MLFICNSVLFVIRKQVLLWNDTSLIFPFLLRLSGLSSYYCNLKAFQHDDNGTNYDNSWTDAQGVRESKDLFSLYVLVKMATTISGKVYNENVYRYSNIGYSVIFMIFLYQQKP